MNERWFKWIYDAVQVFFGAPLVYKKLRQQTQKISGPVTVLDVGGGTGALSSFWPTSSKYICLDTDPKKLRGFRQKHPTGMCILSDGANTPIAEGAVDVIVCSFGAHHLADDALEQLLSESCRVLKPNGRFVLVEPLREDHRLISRALWKIDRGAYPRTALTLRETLDRHFSIEHWQQFTVYHRYVLCVAGRRQAANDRSASTIVATALSSRSE